MLFLYLIICLVRLSVLCDVGTSLYKPIEAYRMVTFYEFPYFPNLLEGIVPSEFLLEVWHVAFRNHQHAILRQYLVKLLNLIAQIEVEAEEMHHLYRHIGVKLTCIKLLFDNRRQMLVCLGVEHGRLQGGVECDENCDNHHQCIFHHLACLFFLESLEYMISPYYKKHIAYIE